MGQDWVSWRKYVKTDCLSLLAELTYCGPLSDAGETEQVLAALRTTNWLQLEPQQADRASVSVLLLSAAAAGVAPNARDCLVIVNLVMITVLVV